MLTTRRSSRCKPKYETDPNEGRKREGVLVVQAAGIRRLGRVTVECFSLLKLVFATRFVVSLV